jgi:hypothetical protein
MKERRRSNTFLILGIADRLLAIGAGLRLILAYENTPGANASSSTEWPAASRIPRVLGLPTLVLMIHPHCPCSRATIGELALLMAQVQGLVNANVLFVRPKGFAEGWEKSDLWNSAAMIPGVKVWVDSEGVEARRFGSKTSGQVMLYNTSGQLLFSGGITASRGHSGDNPGRSALLAFLTGGSPLQSKTAVFGCSLFGKDSNDRTNDSCHAIPSN